MKNKKQYREATICQEEVCRLLPDNFEERANLALLYNLYDQKIPALRLLASIMEEAPEQKKYKGVFVNICGSITLTQTEPLLKRSLLSCLNNVYETNLYRVYPLWIRLVLTDPACADLNGLIKIKGKNDLQIWMQKKPLPEYGFIHEPLFLDGLRLIIITDIIIENFLTLMRQWICLNYDDLAKQGKLELIGDFLCALAEQCFLNEYIYNQTSEERDIIDDLAASLKETSLDETTRRHAYALVACYSPLHEDFPDAGEELKQLQQQSNAFLKLMKTQWVNPFEELKLKHEIQSFGQMQNDVSQKVQEQYEEHPYPRWVSVINFPTPQDDIPYSDQERYKELNILIAGCGTGRQSISAAAIHPNAKITAIDLSKASLSYAQRKANESGLGDRIHFLHADILSMDKWQGKFDVIECSGVLHHMEDPFKGWQILNNLLVDGGYFKIGLYSEIARQHIIEARNFVREHNYPHTTDGIRQCREDILSLPADNNLRKKILLSADFFSTSLLRDLIFHVQEHRMTLPQIEDMMNRLGLKALSFNVPSTEALLNYEKMFPADKARANLKNWNEFELKFPDTFAGMYQFWCQKQS